MNEINWIILYLAFRLIIIRLEYFGFINPFFFPTLMSFSSFGLFCFVWVHSSRFC